MLEIVLSSPHSEIYVPSGLPAPRALKNVACLGVGAHPDDLEILAVHGILLCYGKRGGSFCGVTLTDGAGSGQSALAGLRRKEQIKAARLGRYGAQVLLGYTSAQVKSARNTALLHDLKAILLATRPKVVYTHNLADKHPTHVAVALRVLRACRELPARVRPRQVLGCEVWRGLDWMAVEDKVALPVDSHKELQGALLRVFKSQVRGKRYDLASLGRRAANATFSDFKGADRHQGVVFAMDLTPLIRDGAPTPAVFLGRHAAKFAADLKRALQ